MGNLAAWRAQVEQWQQDESVIERSRVNVNVTFVLVRRCEYCGTTEGNITRHHKGHEYLWAKLLPSRYAKRYISFNKKDWIYLCERHHLKIHRLYEPRLHSLWPLLNRQDGRITFKQCEGYRMKLIRCCDSWIKRRKK